MPLLLRLQALDGQGAHDIQLLGQLSSYTHRGLAPFLAGLGRCTCIRPTARRPSGMGEAFTNFGVEFSIWDGYGFSGIARGPRRFFNRFLPLW